MVAVSEYVPYKSHMIIIFWGQRYALHKKVLYQDKKSVIKIEENSRNSCAGNSSHVSIRYFYVKDSVDKEDFSIENCNTSAMLADFFTKSLWGSLFRRLREVIMGWAHVDILRDYVAPPKKERVENYVSGDEPETSQ